MTDANNSVVGRLPQGFEIDMSADALRVSMTLVNADQLDALAETLDLLRQFLPSLSPPLPNDEIGNRDGR